MANFETIPVLKEIRIKNFKAIRDSKKIRLRPFTVLIGDNGSGKSSLIEALETYRSIVLEGLDRGFEQHGGFEDIWNKSAPHTYQNRGGNRNYLNNPMGFALWSEFGKEKICFGLNVSLKAESDEIAIIDEEVVTNSEAMHLPFDRSIFGLNRRELIVSPSHPGWSFISTWHEKLTLLLNEYIGRWQFLSLNTKEMSAAKPQARAGGKVSLRSDGSNIADFLYALLEKNSEAYNDLIDAMRWVLPYLEDLQPVITPLQRRIHFQMKEKGFDLPSWVLSTGTLRILAILALLRSPTPPPLILIDEIENGLDPRAVNMIVREILSAVDEKQTQVIATTHSPYFLDQLPLSAIVVVERENGGEPLFWSPDSSKEIRAWAERFTTGKLYTMNCMHKPKR